MASYFTVHLPTSDRAQYLADTIRIASGGTRRGEVTGGTVTITNDGLAALAELDDESDGHYDGQHIWIGGSDYQVRPEPVGTVAVDDLAQTIADRYDIPRDAAVALVRTHADQLSNDAGLWNVDAEALTVEGASVVTTAIETGYANDLNSNAESLMLAELENVAATIGQMGERRDELVRSLMATRSARWANAETSWSGR